jgi:hypothetical protein
VFLEHVSEVVEIVLEGEHEIVVCGLVTASTSSRTASA